MDHDGRQGTGRRMCEVCGTFQEFWKKRSAISEPLNWMNAEHGIVGNVLV